MSKINVVENMPYISQCARKMKVEFPSIPLVDITGELILLVLQYADKYDSKYGAITTYIANFPARKLRQQLMYKYVGFTYEDKQRVFITECSINSKTDNSINSDEYINSIKLIEANDSNDYSSNIDSVNIELEEIKKAIKTSNCNKNEILVIEKRFGLNGKHPMSLEEISKDLNLTKQRIQQIQVKALNKLKSNIKIKELLLRD